MQAALSQTNPVISKEALLQPDTAAARASLARLGPRFSAKYTPHFTILSDATSTATESMSGLAEEIWYRVHAFAGRLRVTTHPPANKLLVIYFDTWADYEAFLRPGGFVISPTVPGFFDQINNRCLMFNSANGPLMRKKRRELTTVASDDLEPISAENLTKAQGEPAEHQRIINETVFRHELAHDVLFNIGIQTEKMRDRRWLQEGLAMQFESAEPVSPYRAADFLAIDAKDCIALCRSVIADPRLLAPGAEDSARAYAIAWAVVHYLVTIQPKPFATYLTSHASRPHQELATFERVFGPVDAAFVDNCRKEVAAAQAVR
jgi:hypothetical protein